MNCKVGELVWVPADTRLFWARKEEKFIKRTKITGFPQLAVVIDNFDEANVIVFYDGDYWIIQKKEIYEVSNVRSDGCS